MLYLINSELDPFFKLSHPLINTEIKVSLQLGNTEAGFIH